MAVAVGASAYAYMHRRRKREPDPYLIVPSAVAPGEPMQRRTRVARGIYLPVFLLGVFLHTMMAVPSLLSDMFQGVYGILRVVAQIIVDMVQVALDDFFAGVSAILDALSAGLGFVRWSVNVLQESFTILANQLREELSALVTRTVDMATWALRNGLQTLRDSFNTITSTISGIVDIALESFYDAVIRPALDAIVEGFASILDFVNDPIGFIRREIESALAWIIGNVKDALYGSIDFFADLVRAALNYMIGGTYDVIDTIKAVWHFVVWMALHPEEVVRQLVRETIQSLTANNSAEFRSIINDMMGDYEDAISSLLGIHR